MALANAVLFLAGFGALVVISLRPLWFKWTFHLLFSLVSVAQLYATALFGGLLASGLAVVFGLIVVLAALVAFGLRAAMFWSGVFVLSLAWSLVIPDYVDPVYEMTEPAVDAAFNLVALAAVTVIVLTYFIRQRDRFQKRSDDLLHNILPDDVATRLKSDQTMIADDFRSASVLFADVVGFTPMSAHMSPYELVGLLNRVFTALDELVEKHGLEKIKTVGDEYMVASGVPRLRADHALAAAELALEIQARMEATEFDGRRLSLRIGINSGPVVAGIIGTHKFSYDIWGDTVNTASRMESEGVPGRIQLSAATHALIRDRYLCEPRGTIDVKGKGQLETYFLVGRLDGTAADG